MHPQSKARSEARELASSFLFVRKECSFEKNMIIIRDLQDPRTDERNAAVTHSRV